MINGKRYAWEDITIRMPHGVLVDVDSIDYSDKTDVAEIYGRGSKPQGYGSGNYSAEGKLTLLREEFSRLLDYARSRGRKLYRLPPFTIVVSYANEDEPLVTDVLRGCVFTETSTSSSQGDQSVKVELSIKILDGIVWNGVEAS